MYNARRVGWKNLPMSIIYKCKWWKILTNKKGYSCIVDFYHTVTLSYPQLHLTESFQGSKRARKLKSINGLCCTFYLELSLDSFEPQRTFCRNQSMLNDSPFAILPGNHFKNILGWNSSGSRKDGRKLAFASHNSARLTYGLTAIFDFAQRVGYAGTSWHTAKKWCEKRGRINNAAWIPSRWVFLPNKRNV